MQERLGASDKQIKDMKVRVIEELQAWAIRNDNRIDGITRKIDNKIEDIAKALESRKDIAPLSTSNCPLGLDGKRGMSRYESPRIERGKKCAGDPCNGYIRSIRD